MLKLFLFYSLEISVKHLPGSGSYLKQDIQTPLCLQLFLQTRPTSAPSSSMLCCCFACITFSDIVHVMTHTGLPPAENRQTYFLNIQTIV